MMTLEWLLARASDGQVLARSGRRIKGVDLSALTAAGDLKPTTTASYDLGTTSLKWRTLILSASARIPLILDTNGCNGITIGATASAINGLVVTNSATGNPVQLSPGGASSDSNVGLVLHGQGTGSTALTKVDGTTKLFEVNQTGIGFFASPPSAKTAVNNVAAQDVTASPTQTTINTAVNAVGTALNALLAELRTKGLVSGS